MTHNELEEARLELKRAAAALQAKLEQMGIAEPDDPGSGLLTDDEVATLLRTSIHSLRRWRGRGSGPHYIALSGRCVRYHPEDVVAFISAKKRLSTKMSMAEADVATT